MNVRFKMTNKGEPSFPAKNMKHFPPGRRKPTKTSALARLVASARNDIAAGMPLISERSR